jgi:preprotein translocase subunit SecD
VLVAAVVLAVLLAGTALAGVLLLQDDEETASGAVNLRQPLQFQQVRQAQPPPCASGMLEEVDGSECFRLEPGGMTVRRLEDIRVLPPSAGITTWSISMRLTPTDKDLFGELSGRAHTAGTASASSRIALVVDGVVLSAPTIAGPITGGEVQISGKFTQQQARQLVQRMTGRPAS